MANYKIRNLPQIKLTDLLKKRKTTLEKYLSSYGIFTYASLVARCEKIGVSPPPEKEFEKVVESRVSSPQEGVVVLEPPALTKESTGQRILPEEERTVESLPQEESRAVESFKKKHKKNKPIEESNFVNDIFVIEKDY